MESRPTEAIILKDYPVALWGVGALLTLGGLVWEVIFLALEPGGFWPAGRELAQPGSPLYMIATGGLLPGAVMFLVGAPLAFLSSVLTVSADRLRGMLTLRYRSLLRSFSKEFALNEIVAVIVDSSRSSHDGHSSTTYCVALVLASGKKVPLRGYYSSGYDGKERVARRLRESLGVPETDMRPAAAYQSARQLFNPSFTPEQEGTTAGVNWRLESASFGGMPVSRWVCSDARCPGVFVCLMQRPPDPKAAQGGGGLAGKVSRVLYRQVLSMYGIAPGALPGFDAARTVEGLDPRLAPSFASLTNDQASARQYLNPWVVTPLAQWADEHPMKAFQDSGQAGQLIVLFSPEGVSLTWLNAGASDQGEAMTRLGVDLVRGQG